ncbi:hypothetical protein [Saccharothrix coeruleofusca]|uniref:DUF8129 domain-containing protein n=1 Tax=Saccharothrix coeruleofusca TaxID=33919 RepID=A0A918ALM5_9PSEU|nr:hypothetical protein [Saccharothrix coeruleofusca]MBP2336173.1 hypothetical protein [Saccharothrix coeruleofusca]GGP54892.1 hypothetical protein GCM10010185_29260 [Saccharothrix coeruleofusca]
MSTNELPIPDYDQIPLGDLRHRVRSLSEQELRGVLEHEREHGNRAPVLQVLTARLEELEGGAEPSGGDPRNAPEVAGASGVPPVSPEHSPEDNTPLRHGVYGQTPARGRN